MLFFCQRFSGFTIGNQHLVFKFIFWLNDAIKYITFDQLRITIFFNQSQHQFPSINYLVCLQQFYYSMQLQIHNCFQVTCQGCCISNNTEMASYSDTLLYGYMAEQLQPALGDSPKWPTTICHRGHRQDSLVDVFMRQSSHLPFCQPLMVYSSI